MKKILIVDDVATNLICLSEVLKPFYDVTTAKSGKQALLLLNEMIPDLIMLDVNMPVMDGFQVYEKLKENPALSEIPVVFLTAETDNTMEVRALKMGAVEFLHKPFEPGVMKTRIDKIMSMQDKTRELKGAIGKDELTKLATRKSLEDHIKSKGDKETGFFLIIDLDNFKKVNDNYGHVVGDSVIVKVAKVLQDIAGSDDIVCRLGGDEFAMYIDNVSDREEVKAKARRLIATTEFEIGDMLDDYSEFKVSISIGIAERPSDGTDFFTLYGNADKALYFVKQNGKRGYHFYDSIKSPEDFEEENNKINLMQLQRLIGESEEAEGAYKVSYGGFKKIYRFVARCIDRKNQEVQIVLFTLVNDDVVFEEDNEFIKLLGSCVENNLRRGDVATRCGECQFVAILMDANLENGRKVAERIKNMFDQKLEDDKVRLDFEIETVNGRTKEST